MSTVVVVRKAKQAAIGADTLAKLGATKEAAEHIVNPAKIIKVGDSYIATVGHASWDLVLSSYFSKLKMPPKLDSKVRIFEEARKLHHVLKDKYFLNPKEDEEDSFESSRMDSLIANPSGIFGLYSVRSVQEYSKFYAFGTGYKFALGAMQAIYSTNADAKVIAQVGLEAAAMFDDSTQAPLEIKTIRLK
jgi:ATP-dependent HslUV protease, peptidase subunit HslV